MPTAKSQTLSAGLHVALVATLLLLTTRSTQVARPTLHPVVVFQPRRAPVARLAAFEPRQFAAIDEDGKTKIENGRSLLAPELEWLASLTLEDFSRVFRGSAVKRAKWRGLVRNACVALGNSSIARDSGAYRRVLLLLSRLADADDALIAEHARWALARLALQGLLPAAPL